MNLTSRVVAVSPSAPIDHALLDHTLMMDVTQSVKVYDYKRFKVFVYQSGHVLFMGTFSNAEVIEVANDIYGPQNVEIVSVETRNASYLFESKVPIDLTRIAHSPLVIYNPRRFSGARISSPDPDSSKTMTAFANGKITVTGVRSIYEAVDFFWTVFAGFNSAIDAKFIKIAGKYASHKCLCLREFVDDLVLRSMFEFLV
jgi:TATA-box binding protein (TBP) (component of TFIID and TFIIIB)